MRKGTELQKICRHCVRGKKAKGGDNERCQKGILRKTILEEKNTPGALASHPRLGERYLGLVTIWPQRKRKGGVRGRRPGFQLVNEQQA